MSSYDKSRGVWKLYADTTRPGDPKRSRLVRQFKAPNTAAGRKMADAAEVALQAETRARMDRGEVDRSTFRGYADRWCDHREANAWKPGSDTAKTTRGNLRHHVYPTLGGRRLDDITPDDIDDLFAAMDLAPATKRRVYGTVHAIFETAWRKGVLNRLTGNPMDHVDPVGGAAPERDIPTPAEVHRIADAAATDRQRVFLLTAASTGARRGSLLGLQWRHFDLDAGTVWFKVTKESRPYTIHLPGELVALLRGARKEAAEVALALGERARIDDLYLFSNDGGLTPWQAASASRVFRLAAAAAELPAFHLHDLRHFHASTCLNAGTPAKDVAVRLGCTEANVIKTYSHRVASGNDARAAAAVDAALFGAVAS